MSKEEINKTLKALELIRSQFKSVKDNCAQLTSLMFKRAGLDEDEVNEFLQLGAKKSIFTYQKEAEVFDNTKINKTIIVPKDSIASEVDNARKTEHDYPKGYTDYAFVINRKKFDAYFQKLKKEAGKLKSTPVFKENPPRIIMGDKFIPIEHGSIQHCACKVMLKKPVGEVVEWDEIATEIDGQDKLNLKTTWRSVYDAIVVINKKFREKTGKSLFKTSRKSFYRLI
jgi:hypothetical protein